MLLPYQTEQSRINHFMEIQSSTIDYYKKAAFITTDSELKKVLDKIIRRHVEIRKRLGPLLKERMEVSNRMRKVKGLLERLHREFYISLILNTRENILEYVWQSECKMLQEVKPMMKLFSKDSLMVALLQQYDHEIDGNLINLETYIMQSLHRQIVF